jgi:phosphoenolpyruvate carboxylase
VQGSIRITEQGEVIAAKFSNAEVGRRNLEILAAATLEATLLQGDQPPPRADHLAIMAELSENAFQAYRGLVYETEGFEQYFWESTVIGEIANLNIGSRPASRKNSRKIEDLRAIPWVFSWAQCRLMLPGWFGFGSAVAKFLQDRPKDGMATLQAMQREWPFFRTLLSNMDMVLAKSDIAIAERYAALVADEAMRNRIFGRLSGRMAPVDRRRAGDHPPSSAAGIEPAAGALDPQPLRLSGPAQPRADRAAETPPRPASERGGCRRARAAGRASEHQRRRRRACATAAQQHGMRLCLN